MVSGDPLTRSMRPLQPHVEAKDESAAAVDASAGGGEALSSASMIDDDLLSSEEKGNRFKMRKKGRAYDPEGKMALRVGEASGLWRDAVPSAWYDHPAATSAAFSIGSPRREPAENTSWWHPARTMDAATGAAWASTRAYPAPPASLE